MADQLTDAGIGELLTLISRGDNLVGIIPTDKLGMALVELLHLRGTVGVLLDRLRPLEAFTTEVAATGMGADLNPGCASTDPDAVYRGWAFYMARVDGRLRERAVTAIEQAALPDGARS